MVNHNDINTWFHYLGGNETPYRVDEKFKEYRKKWRDWPKTFKIGEFPLFLDIEVTNFCNLNCPFCATTMAKNKYSKGFITNIHVKKIIDEGAEHGLYGVKFNIRGEPLLHPLIDSFICYAKKKGMIDVYFNTNAMLLSDSMCYKLIDAGLDRISISFEGYTKDFYEINRVGANFEKVIENIQNLKKIKKKLNVKHPRIRIQTIKLPEIDLERYKNFWEDVVDEVAYLDYKDMGVKNKGKISSWKCHELWQRMAVLWNGDIYPCNHDDNLLMKLGNIEDTFITDVWNSSYVSHIRNMHRSGKSHFIEACDGCYLRNSEILKKREK